MANLSAFAEQVTGVLFNAVQHIPPTHIVHQEEDGNTIDYHPCALFTKVINHGIEHRTNIITILSNLGPPTPEVDGWRYTWSHPDLFHRSVMR